MGTSSFCKHQLLRASVFSLNFKLLFSIIIEEQATLLAFYYCIYDFPRCCQKTVFFYCFVTISLVLSCCSSSRPCHLSEFCCHLFCTAHPLLRIILRHPRWWWFFPLERKEQTRATFAELKLLFAIIMLQISLGHNFHIFFNNLFNFSNTSSGWSQ